MSKTSLVAACMSALFLAACGASQSGPTAQSSGTTTSSNPRLQCAQTSGKADFLGLTPGSFVEIREPLEDGVELNWAQDMGFYVGQVTRVEELLGLDAQGCPVVHLEADHQVFYWRVRDLQPVVSRAPSAARCGQNEASADYNGLNVGSRVTILAGTDWHGALNWAESMNAFQGQRTVVTKKSGVDAAGCPGVELEADGGQFFWRVRDLQAN